MIDTRTKVCTKCGIEKELGEFGPRGDTRDGLRLWCKPCGRAAEAARRKTASYPVSVTEKACAKCGVVKAADEFVLNKACSDGLASWCRRCAAGPQRAHRERNQAYINSVKDVPCEDCGQRFPSCVMEFDHIDRSQKRSGVSSGCSLEVIKAEIAKCRILCSNCHQIRTHADEGLWTEKKSRRAAVCFRKPRPIRDTPPYAENGQSSIPDVQDPVLSTLHGHEPGVDLLEGEPPAGAVCVAR